jgi:hypothetical protein
MGAKFRTFTLYCALHIGQFGCIVFYILWFFRPKCWVSHLGMGFRCGLELGLFCFGGLGSRGCKVAIRVIKTSCEVGVVCNIVCWSVMARW